MIFTIVASKVCLRPNKNHDFVDCGLKGVPPAAKNHHLLDCVLKGVPPAATNPFSLVFGTFFCTKTVVFQWIS